MRIIFVANEMLTLRGIFSNVTNHHFCLESMEENRGKSNLVKNNRGELREPGYSLGFLGKTWGILGKLGVSRGQQNLARIFSGAPGLCGAAWGCVGLTGSSKIPGLRGGGGLKSQWPFITTLENF